MNPSVWSDPFKRSGLAIARPGYPLLAATAFVTVVFALLDCDALAVIGLAGTLFVGYFFRDPERVIASSQGAVVSPADGRIIVVEAVDNSPLISERCIQISIFMSVFNVHVNRIPHEGKITNVNYSPGKFFAANLDKASKQNEHNSIVLETDKGKKIGFVQVAGVIARRIICEVQAGDVVKRGQRFGMICFGSRLDVYLPVDTQVDVCMGDRVKAGATVLGSVT